MRRKLVHCSGPSLPLRYLSAALDVQNPVIVQTLHPARVCEYRGAQIPDQTGSGQKALTGRGKLSGMPFCAQKRRAGGPACAENLCAEHLE